MSANRWWSGVNGTLGNKSYFWSGAGTLFGPMNVFLHLDSFTVHRFCCSHLFSRLKIFALLPHMKGSYNCPGSNKLNECKYFCFLKELKSFLFSHVKTEKISKSCFNYEDKEFAQKRVFSAFQQIKSLDFPHWGIHNNRIHSCQYNRKEVKFTDI